MLEKKEHYHTLPDKGISRPYQKNNFKNMYRAEEISS